MSNNLQLLLDNLNVGHIYRGFREHWIKRLHPDVYSDIMEYTRDLPATKFSERLYYYANRLTSKPKCSNLDCTNTVNFDGSGTRYKHYCSNRCALKYSALMYGVTNISQLETTKEQKRQKSLQRYGVDNVSKSAEVKQHLAKLSRGYWERVRAETVEELRGAFSSDITEEEYRFQVARITEYNYRLHINAIDPYLLRGKTHHLDHKVSKFYGWHNRIPPAIIGDVSNLEIVGSSSNMSKSHRNSQTITELYEKYNSRYSTCEKPPVEEIITGRYTGPRVTYMEHTSGVCHYCGSSDARYLNTRWHWCCQKSHNSCPANKEKNRLGQIAYLAQRDATN